MLQRIQTLFLFVALACEVVVLVAPLAYLQINENVLYEIYSRGYFINNQFQYSYVLFIVCIISLILSLIIIFLYKNRILQMRLTIYNFILLLVIQGIFIYVIYHTASRLSADIYLRYASLLPVISALFHILAFRYIKRDEELVKAADRIR